MGMGNTAQFWVHWSAQMDLALASGLPHGEITAYASLAHDERLKLH